MLAAAHATLALTQGRFDEAPALIRRAAEIGGPVLAWNAGAAQILQRFLLCRQRGGLDAYLAEVGDDEPAFPSPLVHRSVLAHGYARLGRLEEAAVLVAEITSHDLSDWHVDEQWFVSLCLLAETCALLDDGAAAATLYDLMVPYADHNAVAVPEMAMDSTGRPLGLLATTLERFDAADEHFRAAAEMNERMGARPWLAHTRLEHARMLLKRDGDGARAQELLAQARAGYEELGMEDELAGAAATCGLRPSPRPRR
jgi:tetratricopeptide (TPR) repeat protein